MKSLYKKIPVDKILDPARPLRSDLSPESVSDLAESIKKVGIIEPLVVSPKEDAYEVIAGHRRLLAAEMADLAIVPCLVVDVSGIEAEVLKLHENSARADINPIDWARHLEYLKTQYSMTTAKLAELLGMSPAWVEQHLDINNYPVELQEALGSGKIAFSAARELEQIKDPVKRKEYVEYAVKGGVTPALAAEWRRKANSPILVYPSTSDSGDSGAILRPDAEINSICPVCDAAILLEEAVTITIHHYCLPNKT